ncbi:MAG TPA: FAD-dependent oxidoreductase [Spirochaetia bacterium]|nr:FAD-dependent oxidoreductase [Spirochaetia bacterium]
MAEKTRISILGAGYAGIAAAKLLYKRYKKKQDVEITVIDRNPYHTLMTELHEIAGSRTEPGAVQVSLAKIFGGTSVNVVIDEIQTIDFENNRLVSKIAEYPYDHLIIGAGAEPEFFGTPGVQEHSFTCWSLEDAIRIRTHVEDMFRAAAKEPDEAQRREQLTFVIAGAGFTGIELAGELLERRDVLCTQYHINPDEVRVIIVEMKDTILPILPPWPVKKAAKYLAKRGAEVMLNAPVAEAAPGRVKVGGDHDVEIRTQTFIWTCGVHGSEFTSKIVLTKGSCSPDHNAVASIEGIHGMAGCHFDDDERYIVGERGRILVNKYSQSVDFKNVYLVGDVMWYVINGKVVPQIVETALQSGDVAARNIVSDIEGGEKEEFQPRYHGFMVSIGGRYGVAHGMGMSFSGFMAMGAKHLINMHYLLGLTGINAVWEYMQHEFFTIKDHRSFIGGHLAWKVPSYWTFPLRLWLGGKWLYEGIKKITEGWLNPGKEGLSNVWTGAIKMPGVHFAAPVANAAGQAAGHAAEATSAATAVAQAAPAAAQAAADATSAATGAVAQAATAAAQTAADATSAATGAVAQAATGAAQHVAAAASQYGQPLSGPWGIYTWFAQNVLSASPLLSFLLQTLVVIIEVGIGLAFVGGAFTWLAALVSILLGLMFIASGWGSNEILWYMFAALVMFGGAGRGLGLDHWIMPWLKDRWNGTGFAKRTFLYTDEPRDRWSRKGRPAKELAGKK